MASKDILMLCDSNVGERIQVGSVTDALDYPAHSVAVVHLNIISGVTCET